MVDGHGSLPPGWRRAPLEQVCDIIRGVTFSRDEAKSAPGPGLLPVLRAGNVSSRLITDEDLVWIPQERVSPAQRLQPGDIVVATSSGSPTVLGKTARLDHAFEGAVGAFCGIIRARAGANSSYLAYWFQSDEFRTWRNSQARGANIQNLRLSELGRLELDLPPEPLQASIAARLSERTRVAAQVRAAVAAQLADVERLAGACLDEVFNSSRALEWPLDVLRRCTTRIGSGTTPRGGQAAYVDSGIPLIRSQNVRMNRFSGEGLAFIRPEQDAAMAASRVRKGDVLLNITGASIGRVCVVPDEICPANVNQHVSIIRSDGTHEPAFLSFFLSSPRFQRSIFDTQAGATRQALTKANIEQFEVPVPSKLIQREVAGELKARLEAVDVLAHALRAQLAEVEALPDILIREALAPAP